MPEFFIVKTKRRRKVYVNGRMHGLSNTILEIHPGTHEIHIETKVGKIAHSADIRKTSFDSPLIVKFGLPGDDPTPDYSGRKKKKP